MTERINKILKFYKITSARFADEIGVQRSSISHVLSGRNKPSLDFIQKLLNAYPDINSDWLILGKGSMVNDVNSESLFSQNSSDSGAQIKIKKEFQSVPDIKEVQVEKSGKEPTDRIEKTTIPLAGGKSASKIVIFFPDGSFKEYFPE